MSITKEQQQDLDDALGLQEQRLRIDLVYQIENKVSKKNKDMYYPRFTKVIINHFISKDQSIPRQNKVDWHMASNDPILTTMRFIPKHEVVQKYGALLPDTLTNQAMKEEKTEQAPTASPGKRLKATAKLAKTGKKKLHAQGLETLSEIALSKAEQMKIVTKRSKTQFHNSHASGSGADEGTGISLGVPNVPTYRSDDEHISWKSSDEEDDDEVSMSKDDDDNADDDQNNDNADNEGDDVQDDDNEQTESDNDDDDFVHPKLCTFDEKERQDEEAKEEELSDDETSDEESQGGNDKKDKMDKEETNEDEEVNELYKEVKINLEGRDAEMADANSSSVSPGFISNMLNPNPDIDIVSILNLNTESTSLVDVPISMNVEMPPSSITPLPPPPIPFIQPQLRVEAQAENEHFINTLDENMRKIIKKQTSYAVATNLSELELKKILIDKIENNKSIDKSIQQKTLYNALVDTYETDKDILETYGDTVTFKRHRDDEDEDEEPSSAQAKEPIHADEDLEEPAHQEFNTGFTEDQTVDETTQHPDWFQKPTKPLTLDRDWNKTFPTKHGPVQPWISTLSWNKDPCESFNELMDTSLDFSAFMMNRLKVDTLTPKLLAGPTYKLMKGLCKSLIELEYFLEEVYKATTDPLDWNNLEGQQYLHDLHKPLPLISNSRVTKIKAADYEHIKWIQDFIPNLMWSQVPSVYDKHALWGISHWGRKRQQFYGFAVNRESACDVYSKHKILAITKLKIAEWHNYKHLDWIIVRRNDDKLYTFKEGDYNRLRLQDIEDMLLLLVQGKLTNLNVKEHLALGVLL
ncbi:hypothetical protein Tco_0706043 [Tanacetum coccineum]|uniref:Uncharacterized protein n=1 Tax=Tanacetum coccineum TaxID=301880 RepID=A0ABQ4Y764_9ASTR